MVSQVDKINTSVEDAPLLWIASPLNKCKICFLLNGNVNHKSFMSWPHKINLITPFTGRVVERLKKWTGWIPVIIDTFKSECNSIRSAFWTKPNFIDTKISFNKNYFDRLLGASSSWLPASLWRFFGSPGFQMPLETIRLAAPTSTRLRLSLSWIDFTWTIADFTLSSSCLIFVKNKEI